MKLFQNAHIQTLYATYYPKPSLDSLIVERFELPDGDFVDVVWYGDPHIQIDAPIVILFHGLTGSIHSPYILRTMKELKHHGYISVLMHFRGCSGEPNRTPRLYHSGETEDAKQWIEAIRHRFPRHRLFGVGFSLGGNMLLKLMGEMGDKTPLDGAIAVSAPMDLAVCATQINQGFSKHYQSHLLKPLLAQVAQKYDLFDMQSITGLTQKELWRLDTFWKFDDAYTAPAHGFRDVHDYYRQSSAKPYLKAITKPTLILHAQDDPFTGSGVIPTKDELSSSITLELHETGGHLGFVGGSFWHPNFWLYRRIGEYFDAINTNNQKG